MATALHVLLLWTVRFPMSGTARTAPEVTAVLEPIVPARPETEEGPTTPAAEAKPPADERIDARPAPLGQAPERVVPDERPETRIARPQLSERAPEMRTIAPTTLRAPLTPLEATAVGIRRRTAPVDERRMEILRAESLLASRLADLPGVGVPADPSMGLAEGGGVTVPIPWGGFIPGNRTDEVWREERCSGKDDDEADKPGEQEARRSQCD